MTRFLNEGARALLPLFALGTLAACGGNTETAPDIAAPSETPARSAVADPALWPSIETPALDPAIEARIDEIMAQMTLEQKVGQVIQGDSESVTPEDVRRYRLGSVLSGGSSAPGDLPYASTDAWLEAADAYWEASVDPEGVEIAIPIIWGIDAVHGHTNLSGAIAFPHNIGLGAARNPDLIEEIAKITAQELTVSGHDWTFAPTLAVPQNDRWGRTYEGFSEDPEIVASYGDRIVWGLQGRDTYAMGEGAIISSAKHFVGDGGTTNGVDRGNTQISEEELRDIHAAGYFPAIEAGVHTIMASFNEWNGVRMHGNESLLTDVLKEKMNFHGFIVGDWDGHQFIPGCTATDCPQSLNAGLDMYMAPGSWKGLYESTLRHVQEGTIPMERLDDAVRRILRVKLAYGVFDRPKPSERPNAGNTDLLGTPEHRAIARQAVRESMVLLKNNGQVLPLDPTADILVIGDFADSISKVSGGWTLSWQGGEHTNAEFPNGQSILSAMEEIVTDAGGTVAYDRDGITGVRPEVVVAIYGEEPYAEMQGDISTVDFVPSGFDPAVLEEFQADGVPVVSVFVSGRPLYVNPELNASDAFVAAFLPGSEGGGVADLLLDTGADHDFTGRLSYSWPKSPDQAVLNAGMDGYEPLFPLGYGLSLGSATTVQTLEEVDGASGAGAGAFSTDVYSRGAIVAPYQLALVDGTQVQLVQTPPTTFGPISVSKVDIRAQEDGLRMDFAESGQASVAFVAPTKSDLSDLTASGLSIRFDAVSLGDGPATVAVAMGCTDGDQCRGAAEITVEPGEAQSFLLAASCFPGADFSRIDLPIAFSGSGVSIAVADIAFETGSGDTDCRL